MTWLSASPQACTGLRISEALHLKVGDVEPARLGDGGIQVEAPLPAWRGLRHRFPIVQGHYPVPGLEIAVHHALDSNHSTDPIVPDTHPYLINTAGHEDTD
jgi:hypothetical protein